MDLRELKRLWLDDLQRYQGHRDAQTFLWNLLTNPGFKYSFYMRLCLYLKDARIPLLRLPLYVAARALLRHCETKYGISIPFTTEVGRGLYIGHYGGIVVSGGATIGESCNISQGVTVGRANRGRNQGFPRIGSRVYIGPGAKIVGAVKVGDGAAIGANCVVTRDVPENGVVVGVPGRVISDKGSEGYVNHTDYEE